MFRKLLLIGTIGLLAGCSIHSTQRSAAPTTGPGGASTGGTTTAATAPASMAVTVYGPDLEPRVEHVAATRAVAAASLRALGIDAPVTLADGTATVALPHATDTQVRQIVLTLTQYPTIRRVDVAGRTGLTRADALPPIVVVRPEPGESVPATFTVSGTASVFEATLVVELRRDGEVLVRRTVTASAGAPERGTYSVTIHAPSGGAATVAVYAPDAATGAAQHEQDVGVTVAS